jgi:energy-coupling factor transporter ATP-binding protein EcfA2
MSMQLKGLELRDFKCISRADLALHPLNVIVGGNNSGKSSVLQGVHFFLTAAIASREAGHDTYRQELLLFCPAHKFEELGHDSPYSNQSHKGYLKVKADVPGASPADYEICVYRGRNEGNVGCTRTGQSSLGQTITDANKLFSIYVPGIAGIPPFEQFRSESVVRRGVASGDANLYLRNVLLQISRLKKNGALSKLMRSLFPRFLIKVKFEPRSDLFIDVQICLTGYEDGFYPIELAGTGVLQALQIFSYVTLYEPQLLLLDEPDSHLHPDNQALLASALRVIASETSTQIILSTHSRHLVDSFENEANFIWLKQGKVYEQGVDIDCLPLLMDIGALNDFDQLKRGMAKCVFLSEDADLAPLKTLAEKAGFQLTKTLFFSYRGSGNLETARSIACFVKDIAPMSEIVIHRDRDFMTDSEVAESSGRIASSGAHAFITEGSDIESYFVTAEHIAELSGKTVDFVTEWLDAVARDNHNELLHAFTRKRDAVKYALYKGRPDECPNTLELVGSGVPLSSGNRLGKSMLRKINEASFGHLGAQLDLLQKSEALNSPGLSAILHDINRRATDNQ